MISIASSLPSGIISIRLDKIGRNYISFVKEITDIRGYKYIIISAEIVESVKAKRKKNGEKQPPTVIKMTRSYIVKPDFTPTEGSGIPSEAKNNKYFKSHYNKLRKLIKGHLKDGIFPYESIDPLTEELMAYQTKIAKKEEKRREKKERRKA